MGSSLFQRQVLRTYFALRYGVGAIGLAFPFFLAIAGILWAEIPLQNSMSAYYHASGTSGHNLRDWFVGVNFAVGACLGLYQGFSTRENRVLNAAGILVAGVAVFPMHWPEGSREGAFSLHGVCAVSFFLCIAYVCVFCARESLQEVQDAAVRRRYNAYYRTLGVLMVALPGAAFVLSRLEHFKWLTFFAEAFGIVAFSTYWFVKSRELKYSQAEVKHLERELTAERTAHP